MNKIQLNKLLDKRIKEVEFQINAIQKSTRTYFPELTKPHNFLRSKFNWYETWHLNPWVTRVHVAVLVLYSFFMIAFAGNIILNQPQKTQAATFSTTVDVSSTPAGNFNSNLLGGNLSPWGGFWPAARDIDADPNNDLNNPIISDMGMGIMRVGHGEKWRINMEQFYLSHGDWNWDAPRSDGNTNATFNKQIAWWKKMNMPILYTLNDELSTAMLNPDGSLNYDEIAFAWAGHIKYLVDSGVNIQYVEIGNELDIAPMEGIQKPPVSGTNLTPSDQYINPRTPADNSNEYIKLWEKVYPAIKAQVPSVKIGAYPSGQGVVNTPYFPYSYLFQTSAYKPDFYPIHQYSFAGNTDSQIVVDSTWKYGGRWTNSWEQNPNMNKVKDTLAGWGVTNPELLLTEFNYDGGGQYANANQMWDAIYYASTISQAANEGFTATTYWDIFPGSDTDELITSDYVTSSLRSQGLAMRLLKEFKSTPARQIMQSSVSSSDVTIPYNWDRTLVPEPAATQIKAISKRVESLATKDASGNYKILLINKNAVDTHNITVNLAGQTNGSVSISNYNDRNSLFNQSPINSNTSLDNGSFPITMSPFSMAIINVVPATANGIYVAKTGDDTTGDGTEAKPYKTIQKAATEAVAGKTVYVKAGTYDERVTIPTTGTEQSPINIQSYDTNNKAVVTKGFTLSGSYATIKNFEITPGDGSNSQVIFSGDYNTTDNLYIHDIAGAADQAYEFQAGADHNIAKNGRVIKPRGVVDYLSGSSNNTVNNIYFEKFRAGNAFYGTGNIFSNNEVNGNENGSDFMYPSGRDNIFRGNKVYGLHKPAGSADHTDLFQWWQGAPENFLIENNILGSRYRTPWGSRDPDNTHIMIATDYPTIGPITIRNNIFLGGGNYVININTSGGQPISNFRIYNNIFYTSSIEGYAGYHNWENKNNIYIDGSDGGLGDGSNIVSNNIYSQGAKPAYALNSIEIPDPANIYFENPIFSDQSIGSLPSSGYDTLNANWHLRPGSPAIDAGIADSNTPLTDKDGNLRGSSPDIGAYEYAGGGTPPAETLLVALSAAPASGNAPLSGVALSADVSGTATGTMNYTFYCNRSDTGTNITTPNSHKLDGTTNDPYSAPSDTCNSIYANPGTYIAKVIAERGSLAAEARTTIIVTNPASPGTNVALAANGGTIVSQSHQQGNGPATGLIDGIKVYNQNTNTWMVQNPTGTESVVIRFSSPNSINRIEHFNDGQYGARGVTVSRSDNGSSWTPLAAKNDLKTTPPTTSNQDTLTFDPVTTQYLKFEYTSFINSSWLQLNEIEVYTAESGGPGPPSASLSTVTANPATVTVPGSSTITITLKDVNNNPIPSHSVTLSSTYQGAGDIITQPSLVTNSSGVTTGSISSALAHTSVITARDTTASLTLSQAPQVTFQATTLSDKGGYVLNGWGGLHPFGGASSVSNQTHWVGWDIARDFVLRSNGTSGYVLDGWGGIHPFGGAPSVSITGYWPGWDIARAIVLRDDNSGYVLNGWGGVWPFGGAPALSNQTHWINWDIARDIVLRSDNQGGYVLNKFGGIHRFGNAPNISNPSPVWWSGIARAIVLKDDNSGYVLNGWGGIHPFGGASSLSNQTHWLNWDIARDLDLRSDKTSGYVLNGWGGVHPFGDAPRIPNQTNWLNWDIARRIKIVR